MDTEWETRFRNIVLYGRTYCTWVSGLLTIICASYSAIGYFNEYVSEKTWNPVICVGALVCCLMIVSFGDKKLHELCPIPFGAWFRVRFGNNETKIRRVKAAGKNMLRFARATIISVLLAILGAEIETRNTTDIKVLVSSSLCILFWSFTMSTDDFDCPDIFMSFVLSYIINSTGHIYIKSLLFATLPSSKYLIFPLGEFLVAWANGTLNDTAPETEHLIPFDFPTKTEVEILALNDPSKLKQPHYTPLSENLAKVLLELKLEAVCDVLIKWKKEANDMKSLISDLESQVVDWRGLAEKCNAILSQLEVEHGKKRAEALELKSRVLELERTVTTRNEDLRLLTINHQHACAELTTNRSLLESKDVIISLLTKDNSALNRKKESDEVKKRKLEKQVEELGNEIQMLEATISDLEKRMEKNTVDSASENIGKMGSPDLEAKEDNESSGEAIGGGTTDHKATQAKKANEKLAAEEYTV